MAQIKFGTDGWRAIIGADYTYDNVAQVLNAFCLLQQQKSAQGPVVLGYDRRFSSKLFAEHAAKILLAHGFEVLMSDSFCPTPCISWMVKTLKAQSGVVITASHNPFQWNGVKFKESYGGSASPEYCTAVEKEIQKNEGNAIPLGDLKKAQDNGQLKYFSPYERYVEQLKSFVDFKKIQQANLKVVVDSMYGAGSGFLKKILNDSVYEIRHEENPSFGGINPEPIDKNMALTFKTVLEQKANLALVTDGDADRIGAVDERGNFVNSHQIFSLILRHLVTQKGKRGDVVKTVSTTQMVSSIAKRYDLPLHETPIGFKHICAKFLVTKPLMGGEESGGIGIADHVYERDGLLCGLLLCEIVATYQLELSKIIAQLQKEFGPWYFQRQDVHMGVERITKLRQTLQKNPPNQLGDFKVQHTNFVDGFKFILADDSWLLIRPSGTEPLLRIYAETHDELNTEKLLSIGFAMAQQIAK
ncbi:MAG: phosphoglucomutase/phosphomannomutase family protein [Deltaproteobacteria bacterium]|nr:phosphoglucomutase/phosphomannomutase family protein [Deltaproteobacteria bacterium]